MQQSNQAEPVDFAGKYKIVAENSQALITWSLSIIGGSIVAIVGTSYIRPAHLYLRLLYLLFIPGWTFLSLSIHKGHKIARHYIASIFNKQQSELIEIGEKINTCYDSQITHFEIALVFFAIWLGGFLLGWIFNF